MYNHLPFSTTKRSKILNITISLFGNSIYSLSSILGVFDDLDDLAGLSHINHPFFIGKSSTFHGDLDDLNRKIIRHLPRLSHPGIIHRSYLPKQDANNVTNIGNVNSMIRILS